MKNSTATINAATTVSATAKGGKTMKTNFKVANMFRRFIAPKAVKENGKAVANLQVGALKKHTEGIFPAAVYRPDHWKDQAMVVNFSDKKTVVVSTNLPEEERATLVQEYPLGVQSVVSDKLVYDILKSYRTSNNLKCGRFAIHVLHNGKATHYDSQKAFLTKFDFSSL